MMDKIPPALQCQINCINALDRTADFKSRCIVILTKEYLLECQLKAYARPQSIARLWNIIDTKSNVELLKEINSIGVQPSVPWPRNATDPTGPPNARPSPPPMPPKRIIKDEKFSVSKADVAAQQKKYNKDYLINLHERMMKINADKPIGPANVKIKEYIITWRYLAVLLLAAVSGNLLGFAIFALFEGSL
jgi:hypothetical protein